MPWGRMTRTKADPSRCRDRDEGKEGENLAAPVEGGLTRTRKQVSQGQLSTAARGGQFGPGVQGKQGDRAIARRESVGDVPAQRGDTAHLGAADQAAGLNQGRGAGPQDGVIDDRLVDDGRADRGGVIFNRDPGELGDFGYIYQERRRRVPSLLDIQQQVGAPGDDATVPIRRRQSGEGIFDTLGPDVLFPVSHPRFTNEVHGAGGASR